MSSLWVARVLPRTTAEGPGARTAVWVQGCSIRCRGCINPHLFPARGGTSWAPDQIVDLALAESCEGLTLLGGEPFDQASACADLAEAARTAGLGVITFTGYERAALEERDADSRRLVAATDLLVDGPYRASEPETSRSLVGSTNQTFHHLTDRYAAYDPMTQKNRVDLRISPTGEVSAAGFLDQLDVARLMSLTDLRRGRPGAP